MYNSLLDIKSMCRLAYLGGNTFSLKNYILRHCWMSRTLWLHHRDCRFDLKSVCLLVYLVGISSNALGILRCNFCVRLRKWVESGNWLSRLPPLQHIKKMSWCAGANNFQGYTIRIKDRMLLYCQNYVQDGRNYKEHGRLSITDLVLPLPF